jgi:DNA-binding response OmpR family regulator
MGGVVLLVDDNEDLLEMTELLFEGAGVRCLAARSLAEVQALGDSLHGVSLAILDVNLGPDEPSGLDVCTWLRAHAFGGRVVFLTGHAPDHPLVEAAAGVDGQIFTKPIASRALLALAEAAS